MADASYSFDILAQVQGGDTSVDTLDRLAQTLTASSQVATQFDRAVAAAKSRLGEASAASSTAADALSSAAHKYDELERNATRAAQAVDKASAAKKDTTQLKANLEAATAAMRAQASVVDELRAKAEGAAAAEKKLAGTAKTLEQAQSRAASGAKAHGQSIEQMTYLAKGALGPMGGLFERGTMLAKGLGSAGVAGAALALVAAFLVLSTAAVGLLVKLTELAITASDAALKSRDMLEGLTGSAAAAGDLGNMIDRVVAVSPQARGEIQKLAEGLYKSGKRGQELENAIIAASHAASGLGKNPSPELIAKRLTRLDVQAIKLKEHIATLFAGSKTQAAVGKFEKALKGFVDLFDTNTASGKALQTLLSTIVDPLIAGLTAAMPIAKELFRGMVLGALLTAIVVVKAYRAVERLFGSFGEAPDIDWLRTGAAVFVVLAVAIGLASAAALALAVVFGVLLVAGLLVMAIPILISAAFLALVGAIVYAVVEIGSYLAQLASAGLEAASNLIAGLASGIASGAGVVYDAIRGMAAGAVSTLKTALGIASPSKVFALQGAFTAEGFAQGVERSDAPATALESMAAPSSQSQTSSPRSDGSRSGGNTFQITVQAPAGDTASLVQALESLLVRILEGDVTQLGGEVSA